MRDNTQTVQEFLDSVAQRLIDMNDPAWRVSFSVPSTLAHAHMPFDRPWISIHKEGVDDGFISFPGDNASECMAACQDWLNEFERKAA